MGKRFGRSSWLILPLVVATSVAVFAHGAGAKGETPDRGYAVINVDVVVIAQQPKLAPHADAIRRNLSDALSCGASQVSIKGKTNEGVDSMGAGESIAVHAVALLARVP